ncbi:MAG: phosphoglycerate mutase (2,3-diphosphoglycerate-independent) [Flavobacteriales bacterium]|nr:MAG: phosphoglycerate mutase (2,3-diphosphoglycerate-independent) [Flavobacteriales bacterium]
MSSKKVALIILDGWGIGDQSQSDAIYNANTPFFDSCLNNYPNSTLKTYGEHVGLPKGQMGNSEVGHLNIGAGRIVYQDFSKINNAVADNSIADNETILNAFKYAKQNNGAVHFMGLVSDGGIHSHQNHLYKLCDLAKENKVNDVFVHAFTDGRDCDPKSGKKHIETLENHLTNSTGKLVSVIGRYYAMDRDNRWERVKKAYDLLVNGEGEKSTNLVNSIQESYNNDLTDEFIKPLIKVDENKNPIATIKENDVVICFNYRTDRCREITIALTQEDLTSEGMKTIPLHYVTMTNYNRNFKNVNIIYDKDNIKNTLGEVLEANNKTQIRIAETEKYPHVTFFFSGGREAEFNGEKRLMAKSPNVATYDLQPEMSAEELTQKIVLEIENQPTDFICLNFANTDMVGHTGVYSAITAAAEKVDSCVERIVTKGIENDYSFIIIADHGNADFAINQDGSPNTAHSVNPVPCILIDNDYSEIKNGTLADIAPTILKLLEVNRPKEMTGDILI